MLTLCEELGLGGFTVPASAGHILGLRKVEVLLQDVH